MRQASLRIAALVLFGIGAGGRAKADLVVNGGFETPVVTNFYYDIYSAGQSFTGWTVDQGSVALLTDQYNPGRSDLPYEGNQALQLASTQGGNGSIYQDLATVPGTTYQLSFAFASNPFASEEVTMNVTWGGATVADLSATPSHDLANSDWVVETFTVTATRTITRLEFHNTTSVADVAGPQIDAVLVNAVPEPSSLVMGMIGLAMAGGIAARKRKVDRKRPSR